MLQNELFRARGTKAHCNSRKTKVQTLRCYPSLLKSPMKPLSDMAKTIIKLFMGRLKETLEINYIVLYHLLNLNVCFWVEKEALMMILKYF